MVTLQTVTRVPGDPAGMHLAEIGASYSEPTTLADNYLCSYYL